MATLDKRRALLRELYGFDFPEDLFRFWEFARRLRPLEPLEALADPLGIILVGPFDVLTGRCDRHRPRLSLLLHWRFYDDPPEFFTVLTGNTDGLHWGYFLDDPLSSPASVASYYSRDAYEFSADGDNLFEAVRLHLEWDYSTCLEYIEDDPEHADDYREDLDKLDALRKSLMGYGTGDRPEVGDDYSDIYLGVSSRNDRITAETAENMGVVVPKEKYRRVALKGVKYWTYLKKTANPVRVVEAARRALRDGYPGTALKIGKDLWAAGGKRKEAYAAELLDAAYAALGREALRTVLRTHLEHRDLSSVDVFDHEVGGNGHV
jgi:hypothetical protein